MKKFNESKNSWNHMVFASYVAMSNFFRKSFISFNKKLLLWLHSRTLTFPTAFSFIILNASSFLTSRCFISLYTSSASGCPIANRNKLRVLENGGSIEQHKAAVAVATAMKFDGVNCPTPGCDGKNEYICSCSYHLSVINRDFAYKRHIFDA